MDFKSSIHWVDKLHTNIRKIKSVVYCIMEDFYAMHLMPQIKQFLF